MFNPVTFSVNLQKMALRAAAATTRMMTVGYVQMVDQQNRLWRHSFDYHRGNDHQATSPKGPRRRRTPCRGPDLMDHYGKRAHDVDPEHI